jgi:hypothetical protein
MELLEDKLESGTFVYTVACLHKARIVKPAETVVTREWLCKHWPLLCSGSIAIKCVTPNSHEGYSRSVGCSNFNAISVEFIYNGDQLTQ